MDANFDACLDVLLQQEGGFVDDPHDPGGATNLGVTLNTWALWVGRSVHDDEIRALTPALVAPLYKARYWGIAHCGLWPAGVDLMVFDAAVNQGPTMAVRYLQRAVGAAPDGIVGIATQAAVIGAATGDEGAVPLIGKIATERLAAYQRLPIQMFERFGKGWTARVARVQAKAEEMAA